MLEIGDGNRIYWERSGAPDGKAAVVLHGGPGSGCSPWFRTLFDPEAYRVVLFDQRNCGRSTPHASEPEIDLSHNTTPNLVMDIERLREHLAIDRWLVLGGSWGSTLALAYAEAHPDRVSELILFGVTTGRREEFEWTFRGGLSRLFPAEWDRLRAAVGDDDVIEATHRLLFDPNPDTRRHAAQAWCLWESATPQWPPTGELAERFMDPDYALAFARIVTHYVRHDAWLGDVDLLAGARDLPPGILVHGRFDLQAPLSNAWELHRAWPRSKLVVVDDSGHAPSTTLEHELRRATDQFAAGCPSGRSRSS